MNQQQHTMISALKEVASHVLPQGAHAWLYGSQARGEAHNGSDWNLLILINKDAIASADEDSISYPFVEMGWKNSAVVSPVLYTYQEWAQRKNSFFWTSVEQDKVAIL